LSAKDFSLLWPAENGFLRYILGSKRAELTCCHAPS